MPSGMKYRPAALRLLYKAVQSHSFTVFECSSDAYIQFQEFFLQMFFTDMVPLHHYLFHFLHTCIHFCHCVRRAAFHSSVTVSDLRTAKVEIFVGISVTALGSVRVSRAAYGALIGRSSSLPVFNYYLYVHP